MSAQITVHVAGSERSVPEGTTAGALFEGRREVLVARVDGELRELSEEINLERYEQHTIEVVVDRLVSRKGIQRRLTDSLETALRRAFRGCARRLHVRRDERRVGFRQVDTRVAIAVGEPAQARDEPVIGRRVAHEGSTGRLTGAVYVRECAPEVTPRDEHDADEPRADAGRARPCRLRSGPPSR